MADRTQVKLHVIKSGILQGQNNGAIIMLATPKSFDKDGVTSHNVVIKSFAEQLVPLMDKFLPK